MTLPAANPAPTPPAASSRMLAWVTLVTALFVVIAGARMLLDYSSSRAADLLEPPQLLAARKQLLAQPKDDALKQQVREMDLAQRQQYFRHLESNAIGGWLLLGAGVLLVISAQSLVALRRIPPLPGPMTLDAEATRQSTRHGRRAVAATATACALAFAGISFTGGSRLPDSPEQLAALLAGPEAASSATAAPSREDWLANWPMFRGPYGNGVAVTTNAPESWNGETGEGIAWKSPVPAAGYNSPIVWGDRVFLTGGDAAARHVLCYDAIQGSLLWDQTVPPPPEGFPKPLEVMEDTGFAASTAATDGQRVFAIFATGELAAFDFSGRLAWSKPLGLPKNVYGHATSLVVWNNLLLVQFDQGDGEDGRSRLYALDAATGNVRWEQSRPVGASWTTPLLAEVGGQTQLLTLGEPWVIGYDVASGTEIWRFDGLGADLAPSPVTAGDLLIVVSPNNHVSGLRLDGRGDVTETHQAWQYDEFVPDITSPVAHGDLIFLLITFGDLVCLEATTGKTVWEQALDLEFNASPTLVGDRLYLTSTEGISLIVQAGREFRELARSELGEAVRASPAFVGDRIYVRGVEHLFCLGDPAPATAPQP